MAIKIMKKRLAVRVLIILILVVILYSNSFQRFINPIHFKETVYHYSEVNKIDPLLVSAIIRVESKFNPQALSQKGAIGLMQIMPSTGEWAAEQMGIQEFESSLLHDPEMNIRIGTWYISSLQKEFEGDMFLVIAAYNGGRGKVKQWLEQEIWDGGEETISNIPFPETRQFVRKVVDNYRKYKKIY